LASIDTNGVKFGETTYAVSLEPKGKIFNSLSQFEVQKIEDKACFYDNSCISELTC
jgi:hypothetical protein